MSEPRYPYVHVDVPSFEAELVSAELFELGALGIEERDATTLLRGNGADAVTLVASFVDDAGAAAAKAELIARYPARLEHVVGDAWRDGWREFFKPQRVGKRLVIVPAWEMFAAQQQDVPVVLEPGQAFGTGTHESTQLVLGQLETCVRVGRPVLDVGTGSGILAIAALLLGASEALAIDVDPLAVSAARQNAARNRVEHRLRASDAAVENVSERYPLVLANIEARVLVPLAPVLMQRLAAGGSLVLSGLLLADADPVRAAYSGLTELARPVLGEWCALVLAAD
jgi:ribosomal protein L11 methyltransferase